MTVLFEVLPAKCLIAVVVALLTALLSEPSSAGPTEAKAGRVIGPPSASGPDAPDGSPSVRGTYAAEVPSGAFGQRGTLSLWFKVPSTLRSQKVPDIPLLSGDAFVVRIAPRGGNVFILTDFGSGTTGTDQDGSRKPYAYQSLLTHLKADTWYHAAWTWDSGDWRRNNFYLDGLAQGGPGSYHYSGQVIALKGQSKLQVGSEGLTVSEVSFYNEPLTEKQLRAVCKVAGHKGYTDEGVRFTGEKFVPKDVDWAHPVYESSFDDPSALNDWRLEGGFRMRVDKGNLVLENALEAKGTNLVCWLTREVPSDFLLEFTIRPRDRKEGLAIVFFNARGLKGESIFDPALSPRTGDFAQYHSGDINCYHTSYWAGGRDTANVRKNKGFHLVSVGKDLVAPAPADSFQTVRIYKRGGKIRLMVDDVVACSYDDDGQTYGPVWRHSGWIGLRQMGHSQWCRYGYVKVYPLKP